MTVYFDSSIVTKWYLLEPDSSAALSLRDRFRPPACLTHLHRAELTTAWHLKIFRKELPQATVTQALADLDSDVEAGIWAAPTYELAAVFARAQTLARAHAAGLGVRTLDILHVAAALELGSRDFVTNDERQGRLAKAAGLRAVMLRGRPGARRQ